MAPDELDPDDADARRLAELEKRLQKARGPEPVQERAQVSGLDMAYRLVAELVAAVLVGMGLGWGLDRLFGTSPLLLIVMLLLGIVAGILGVFRTARDMNANADRGRSERK